MKHIILMVIFLTTIAFKTYADNGNNGGCFFRPLEFQKIKDNIKYNQDGFDKNYCRYGEVFIKFSNKRMINPNDSYNNSPRWAIAKTEKYKILDNKFKKFIKLDEFNHYVRKYKSCISSRKKQVKLESFIRGDLKIKNQYSPPFYGCTTSPKSILYDKE